MARYRYRISLVVLLVLALSAPPTFAIPDEAQDDETYDLSVTGIFPDSDGRVCASRVEPDRYRIRLINARVTGFEATLLESTPRQGVLRSDSVKIDGTLYMFTTGKNDAIRLLATTEGNICLNTDFDQSFSFDVYYLEGEQLGPMNFTFTKR
jgi:hypothetical protein